MDQTQTTMFSPKQVAKAIGVSEASVKRWCDKGILSFTKTAGGHRRVPLAAVIHFVQENQSKLVHPEILGLPSTVGRGPQTLERTGRLFQQALETGQEEQALQLVLDLRLAGHSVSIIADRIIAEAFHRIGQRWKHQEVAVYQERRGIEITRRILHRLKETLPGPLPMAPTAIGAALENDPYTLPAMMAELVLSELGWDARYLGSNLPAESLCHALDDIQPRILWLSISALTDPKKFLEDFKAITKIAEGHKTAVVVGGRMLTEDLRRSISYAAYCDNLQHLQSFAQTLYRI